MEGSRIIVGVVVGAIPRHGDGGTGLDADAVQVAVGHDVVADCAVG